jgi:hypothetical protein
MEFASTGVEVATPLPQAVNSIVRIKKGIKVNRAKLIRPPGGE